MTGWLPAGCAALLLTGCFATACDRGDAPPLTHLVIATGPAGSVYDVLGRALAETARDTWRVSARVQETAASVENLHLVAEGRADLAFATVDAAEAAVQGDAPFARALPLAALAGLYEDYLHIVVRADSRIHQIGDLRGRPVSTGPAGAGTDIVAARILEAGGVGIERINRSDLFAIDATEALRAGGIDAFFVTGGLPTPAISALATRLPIRVLSIPDEVSEIQQRYRQLYLPRSIPAGVYGLDSEVRTVSIRNVLVVRSDLPEDVAYALTRLLFAARDTLVRAHREARRLDARSAVATFPLPLHAGAQRYYRDAKPLALGSAVGTARAPTVGWAADRTTGQAPNDQTSRVSPFAVITQSQMDDELPNQKTSSLP